MRTRFVPLLLAMLVVGCASTSPAIQEALAPARALGTAVDCVAPCTTEWQRAQAWLGQHAIPKLHTTTDVLLQTEPAAASVTGFDGMYAFSAIRTPTANGYRITVEPRCRGTCSPKAEDVATAFLYYVKTGEDVLVGKVGGGLTNAIR